MFDVCMWGCDTYKISSLWTHLGGPLSWNSLGGKQAPFFSFDGQAHLLASFLPLTHSHWPWCCGARQSFICDFIYSSWHWHYNTPAALLCSADCMSADCDVSSHGCHEWETTLTLFLPYKVLSGSLEEPKRLPAVYIYILILIFLQGDDFHSQTYLWKYLLVTATQILQWVPKYTMQLGSWKRTGHGNILRVAERCASNPPGLIIFHIFLFFFCAVQCKYYTVKILHYKLVFQQNVFKASKVKVGRVILLSNSPGQCFTVLSDGFGFMLFLHSRVCCILLL